MAVTEMDYMSGGGGVSSGTCSGIETISANSSATIQINTSKVYAITCWCPTSLANRYSGGAVINGEVTQTFKQSSGAEIKKEQEILLLLTPIRELRMLIQLLNLVDNSYFALTSESETSIREGAFLMGE